MRYFFLTDRTKYIIVLQTCNKNYLSPSFIVFLENLVVLRTKFAKHLRIIAYNSYPEKKRENSKENKP